MRKVPYWIRRWYDKTLELEDGESITVELGTELKQAQLIRGIWDLRDMERVTGNSRVTTAKIPTDCHGAYDVKMTLLPPKEETRDHG